MTTPPLTRLTKPCPNATSLYVAKLLRAAREQPGSGLRQSAETTF